MIIIQPPPSSTSPVGVTSNDGTESSVGIVIDSPQPTDKRRVQPHRMSRSMSMPEMDAATTTTTEVPTSGESEEPSPTSDEQHAHQEQQQQHHHQHLHALHRSHSHSRAVSSIGGDHHTHHHLHRSHSRRGSSIDLTSTPAQRESSRLGRSPPIGATLDDFTNVVTPSSPGTSPWLDIPRTIDRPTSSILQSRPSTPVSVARMLSADRHERPSSARTGGGDVGGVGENVSPIVSSDPLDDRDRVSQIWELYAGKRDSKYMYKRELLQLCEDLFDEVETRYRLRLRQTTHSNDYTSEQMEKDLKNDLPYILPAKSSDGSSSQPSRQDYIRYIYRNCIHIMMKSVPKNLSVHIDRSGTNSPKVTKQEFMMGWKSCNTLLFASIDDAQKLEKRNGNGTDGPCNLM